MYCPNCKKEVGNDALFCPECGTKTVMSALPQNVCRKCGEVLESDMAFCPECGTPVKVDSREPKQNSVPWEQQGTKPQQRTPEPEVPRYQPATPPQPSSKSGNGKLIAICACVAVVVIVGVVALFLPKGQDEDSNEQDVVSSQNLEAGEAGEKEIEKNKEDVSVSIEPAAEAKEEDEKKEAKDKKTVSVIGGENADDKKEEGKEELPKEEAPKTFAGAKNKDAQQGVLATGGQLDLVHMGNLLGNAGATYGTYVLDITNMQEYDGGGANDPLPASALIGVPILFTIADGVDKGEINLDTPVTFNYTFEDGRGIFKSGDSGRTFPVSQMLSEALLNSDNNALNSLMDFLTLDKINEVCHSYGFASVDMQRKLMSSSSNLENYISAKDAALMLNTVYQDNFVGIGKAFLEANFKISSNDTANRGMYPACIGCDTFLNLNGITDSRYNEIGLIKRGDEVFILSVFTCNGDGIVSASALTTLTSYVISTLQAQ